MATDIIETMEKRRAEEREDDPLNVTDARQFGRVAVVMGGSSAERDVSLDSGRNVLDALKSRGVDAHAIDGIPALLDALRAGHFARVFNILHGRGGEDGVLQGALQSLGVPVTGSGVLGSALSMDKIRTKQVWQAIGLPTPRYVRHRIGDDVGTAIASLGLPVVVKPSHEGSSVGITRVRSLGDLPAAVELAARYDGELVVEQMIEGEEYTFDTICNDGEILYENVACRHDGQVAVIALVDAVAHVRFGVVEPRGCLHLHGLLERRRDRCQWQLGLHQPVENNDLRQWHLRRGRDVPERAADPAQTNI
jgi:hypothetical protein